MLKSVLILLNLSGILMLNVFLADGVLIEDDIPNSLAAGESAVVTVNINKGTVANFAKLQYELPEGLKMFALETKGASFTFSQGKAKFIWMALPEEQEFSVKFELIADENATGSKVITGIFSYVKEAQRVDYEMQSKIVEIGGQQAQQSSGGQLSCNRSINKIGEGEYLVTLKVQNGEMNGFVKIFDNFPNNFDATADNANGATASTDRGNIKFVWLENPPQGDFEVSYKIFSTDLISSTPAIDGNLSFVKDEKPQEIKIGEGENTESIAENNSGTNNDTNDENDGENTTMQNLDQAQTDAETEQARIAAEAEEAQKEADALAQRAAQEAKEAEENREMTGGEIVKNGKDKPMITKVPDPETGVNYKIQLLAGPNVLSAATIKKKFSFSEQFNIENHQGLVKYTTGKHDKYKGARDKRESVKRKYNFPGPFVTAYNEGERITVQEALMITNQKWYK